VLVEPVASARRRRDQAAGHVFENPHLVAFAAIWTAAALYLISSWRSARSGHSEMLPE
jgi:hypothetical protein